MTNDIDLDAIEARLGIGGDRSIDDDDVRTLIAAVRSERARADAAEAERERLSKQDARHVNELYEWKVRALAAEAELDSLRTLQETTMDALRVTAEERNAAEPIAAAMEGVTAEDAGSVAEYLSKSGVNGDFRVRKALLRLAAALRAQDEPKRCVRCAGSGERKMFDPESHTDPVACEDCGGTGTKDEPKRESLDCFICGAPWDSPGACQCGRREEPKREPSDIVCDGCGVSEPEHAKYCGEPAYERQVDEDGRTAPDRCGEWVTRAEYEKREPSGEYRDLARAIVAQIHGLTEPKREPSGTEEP